MQSREYLQGWLYLQGVGGWATQLVGRKTVDVALGHCVAEWFCRCPSWRHSWQMWGKWQGNSHLIPLLNLKQLFLFDELFGEALATLAELEDGCPAFRNWFVVCWGRMVGRAAMPVCWLVLTPMFWPLGHSLTTWPHPKQLLHCGDILSLRYRLYNDGQCLVHKDVGTVGGRFFWAAICIRCAFA